MYEINFKLHPFFFFQYAVSLPDSSRWHIPRDMPRRLVHSRVTIIRLDQKGLKKGNGRFHYGNLLSVPLFPLSGGRNTKSSSTFRVYQLFARRGMAYTSIFFIVTWHTVFVVLYTWMFHHPPHSTYEPKILNGGFFRSIIFARPNMPHWFLK